MASPEAQALQTIKLLAQQYKPLIDALPQLQEIVSLQDRQRDLTNRIARLDSKKDELLACVDDSTKKIAEANSQASKIVTDTKDQANAIVRQAELTAKNTVSKAQIEAERISRDQASRSTQVQGEIADKIADLQRIKAEITAAEKTRDEIHRLIDSLRK